MAESVIGPQSDMCWDSIPLPPISGPFVIGLAGGNDTTLDMKLPILTKGDLDTRTCYAGAWAFTTFAHMSADARKLLTSGAMACVRYGLCGTVGLDKDGEWREEATARSEFTELPPTDTCSSESLSTALNIIIATKANWWTKNCHTGPSVMIGYFKKYPYKDFTEAASTMGHWASSIKILSVAGMKGLRTFTSLGLPGEQELTLSRDANLSFISLPAGTHRLAIAYEAAVKLLESPIAAMCPSLKAFLLIPAIYAKIKGTPASYHIEAKYLTGKARIDYDDVRNEEYLGRLGTYVNTMILKSTLARSPRFARSKLQDYPDHDIVYENALASYRRKYWETDQEVQSSLGIPSAAGKDVIEFWGKCYGNTDEVVQEVRDAFGIPFAATGKSKSKGDDNDENGSVSSATEQP